MVDNQLQTSQASNYYVHRCVKPLGVSNNGDSTFPVLSSDKLSASTETPGYQANEGRLDYTESSMKRIL